MSGRRNSRADCSSAPIACFGAKVSCNSTSLPTILAYVSDSLSTLAMCFTSRHRVGERRDLRSRPLSCRPVELSHAEARAARQRRLDQVLAELGMTRADHALFSTLGYDIHVPPEELPSDAEREHNPSGNGVSITEEQCVSQWATAWNGAGFRSLRSQPCGNRP